VYVVFTDREFGFWAVRSYNINHTINYTSRTLNINTGDSIEWLNMDNEGDRITIMSDNILWEGGKTLGGIGSKFRFTFNSSGIFRFHTVENTRIKLNASNYSENETTTTTITYEDDDGELHTITVNRGDHDKLKDVVSTERYNYQQQTIRVTGPTIGNGTVPLKTTPSSFTASIRPVIQVNVRPTQTPSESLTQVVAAAAVPKPLESYQEFTIYAVLKRWIDIIISG
jgi:plastocyanin